MSDAVDRSVGGPLAKKSASQLMKKNRLSAPEQAQEWLPDEPEAEAPASPALEPAPVAVEPVQPAAQPAAADREAAPDRTSPAAQVHGSANDPLIKVTFGLPADLRFRMRAMYRATKDAEDEMYLSEMLARIIERECERREQLYNGGARFTGGERNLPRGRPLA